jgi:hypothetical protein
MDNIEIDALRLGAKEYLDDVERGVDGIRFKLEAWLNHDVKQGRFFAQYRDDIEDLLEDAKATLDIIDDFWNWLEIEEEEE